VDQADIDALLAAGGASAPDPGDLPGQKDAGGAIDQAEIDALMAEDDIDKPIGDTDPDHMLTGSDDSTSIDESSIDTPVSGGHEEEREPETVQGLDQADADTLLDDGDIELPPYGGAPSPEAEKPAASDDGLLSQGALDTVLAPAKDEMSAPAAPPPPEPAPSDEGLLSQDDLDAIIAQAVGGGEKAPAPAATAPAAGILEEIADEGPDKLVEDTVPEEEPAPERMAKPRRSLFPSEFVQRNLVKIAASLAAALVGTLGSFAFLYTNQERVPNAELLDAITAGDLSLAISDAKRFIEMASYRDAVVRIDEALEGIPEGPMRNDAEFLRAKAACLGLSADSPGPQLDAVLDYINLFLDHAVGDPRVPDALMWKGELYEREGIPYAAHDVYLQAARDFPDYPKRDIALMTAGQAALGVNRPEEAARIFTQLLDLFPASPLAARARLQLADAYREAGRPEQAQAIYTRLARMAPASPIGAEALAGLGELAIDYGHYDDAIARLEASLDTATTVENNDRVYLALARSYRAAGRLEDARRTLSDLVDFFPESEVMPAAFNALSAVDEELGNHEQAVRVARQAVLRYPGNADVLGNLGSVLSKSDDRREAAEFLVSAHQAGSNDPKLLLSAARLYKDANALFEARETYRKVIDEFPRTSEAFEADIELAEVQYANGAYRHGIRRLEDLRVVTPEGPQQLPVLMALGRMYQDLGVRANAGEIFDKIAQISAEPEVLARSSMALLDAGQWDEGVAVAKRVDVSKLARSTAYGFLTKYGTALLDVSPERGIPLLEQAYRDYPLMNTVDDERRLLKAYLATDNREGARSILIDAAEKAQFNEDLRPRVTYAANAWGDYLIGKREFRAAAEAYTQAATADGRTTEDGFWAVFQKANALLELADYDGSLALYDEVAQSGTPWAGDAKLKADYVRIEQRIRGLPVTPAPAAAG
ncbi:MAG: tetratricopeptide repeat protein, partial [Nitrospiraceae bacterium]|nr:tetratricopeptide repeat protein [Nitrospiraceae bacterium]